MHHLCLQSQTPGEAMRSMPQATLAHPPHHQSAVQAAFHEQAGRLPCLTHPAYPTARARPAPSTAPAATAIPAQPPRPPTPTTHTPLTPLPPPLRSPKPGSPPPNPTPPSPRLLPRQNSTPTPQPAAPTRAPTNPRPHPAPSRGPPAT